MTLTARPGTEYHALDLLAGRALVVLTGAGLSTDSGIPDYRGPHAPARTPMTYQESSPGQRPGSATGRAAIWAGRGCGAPSPMPATTPSLSWVRRW